MTALTRLLDVPWVGQHFDGPGAWPSTSAMPPQGPRWWGHRSCGLACLRAVLMAHGLPAPAGHELLVRALAHEAYSPRGWIHQRLADLAGDYGLVGIATQHRDPGPLRELARQGQPSIVSTTHLLPQDGRRGGHLVVFVGEVEDDAGLQARFMCPSRWGRTTNTVSPERFWASWTGRSVVLRPSGGGGADA